MIIPAYNCQGSLDLTLASLSRQTYRPDLLEVVVVDDGSQPPIELPKIRPANCRLVRVSDSSGGWGPSHARHIGVLNSDGDILHWLDADMVVFPEHVEAQARWHHVSNEAVTLGYKRFVRNGWATPDEVAERCAAGTIDQLFPLTETEPHDYVERLIETTDQLRAGDHLNFLAHVGATAALTRTLYEDAGGLNTELRLGEDTEFGYRLAQAGAVFIPEPLARGWHMGPSSMMARGAALRRHNHPFLADLMAQPRHLRPAANRCWAVPLVTVVVPADGRFELVRTCVDRLLSSDLTDLRVKLVADWAALPDGRRSILADPFLDRRLLAANYRSEPRVDLVPEAPATGFPSPFLLAVPPHLGVAVDTVRRLVAAADEWQMGLVRLLPSGGGPSDGAMALWRTAALTRAMRARRPDEPLDAVAAQVAGERSASGTDFNVTDLRLLPEAALVSPRPRLAARPDSGGAKRPVSGGAKRAGDTRSVPVGGIRSLGKAVVFVGRRYTREAGRQVRRRLNRHSRGSRGG